MTTRATANKLWVLDAPKIATPKSLVVTGAGDEIVTMPCAAFLIEHDRGLVLVDSMCDPAAVDDIEGRYGPLAALFVEYTAEQTVEANLKRLGFGIGDVSHVVVSHLHFDHAGSFGLFEGAKFFIGVDEMTHATRPPRPDPFYDRRDVEPIEGFTRFEVGGDHDLFDDGAITLLHMPGHAVGQLALLVRLPSQNILLACDVVHHMDAFEAEAPMVADYDFVAATASIRRCKLVANGAGARVLISHYLDQDIPVVPDFIS